MEKTRKLAAIMFTDIEGYTALMQQDEAVASKLRERHREVFEAVTARHNGKILQYYGDGTLSIFESAYDAVECGIELQKNYTVYPEVPVRIGIHTGDIVISEDDIIGDGVNVASRIESLAVPGSVLVSDKVYDEIKNQSSIQTTSLGIFDLKNVTRPTGVFAISNEGMVVPEKSKIRGKTAEPNEASAKVRKYRLEILIPGAIILAVAIFALIQFALNGSGGGNDIRDNSIAVLAFENLSNDPEQEYFSDGISEEILNSLAQIEDLNVAGRTSSFSFKGTGEDIKTIGEKLDVSMVLEGSVRKSGDKVRVTAQLIDVSDGYHIWSQQYDRELKDIFLIQEEIAKEIVRKLRLTVIDDEIFTPTQNLEAYEAYMRGRFFLAQDIEGTQKAMKSFDKAIQLDPEFSLAWAGKADAFTDYAGYGIIPSWEAFDSARISAERSISLMDNAYGHKIMAYVELYYNWNWEAALLEYERALEMGWENPDHWITWYDIFISKDYKHAIEVAKQIRDSRPLDVEANWHLGVCFLADDQFENAITEFQAAIDLNPGYSEGYRWTGICYDAMGEYDKAIEYLEKAAELTGGWGPAITDLIPVLSRAGQAERSAEMLESFIAATNEFPLDPMILANLYADLGNTDLAIEYLQEAYRKKSSLVITIRVFEYWAELSDDPRFKEIWEALNFPVD